MRPPDALCLTRGSSQLKISKSLELTRADNHLITASKIMPLLTPNPTLLLPRTSLNSSRSSVAFRPSSNTINMTDINLHEVHDLLIDVAHEAGRMMLAATPSYLSSGTKKNCTSQFMILRRRKCSNLYNNYLTS